MHSIVLKIKEKKYRIFFFLDSLKEVYDDQQEDIIIRNFIGDIFRNAKRENVDKKRCKGCQRY